jgi:hypothetical protein
MFPFFPEAITSSPKLLAPWFPGTQNLLDIVLLLVFHAVSLAGSKSFLTFGLCLSYLFTTAAASASRQL